MERHLTDVTLKSGEAMQLICVTAPDPAWAERILPFLQHKGESWKWQMRVAFDDGLGACTQRSYVGVVGGEVAGQIMTWECMDPPIGIISHVFTNPEHRRKGIASHIMEALTDDFRARGGRAMFLHTGHGSPPFHIYASYGFVGYRETGSMSWLPEEDFWEKQFSRRPVQVRDTNWGDWAGLEALAEVDSGWHVRSVYFGFYGFHGFEGQYIDARLDLEAGRLLEFKVLAAEDGAVMGYAMIGRLRHFPGNPLALDMFVHPNFVEHAPELARAVWTPKCCEKVLAFGDSASVGKPEALAAADFALEATIAQLLTDGHGNILDLQVFSRE